MKVLTQTQYGYIVEMTGHEIHTLIGSEDKREKIPPMTDINIGSICHKIQNIERTQASLTYHADVLIAAGNSVKDIGKQINECVTPPTEKF